MASLAKTKHRIASIKGTEKITKAMELVATVKTKRFLTAYERGKTYAQEYISLMSQLFAYDKETSSHYAKMNEGDLPILYLVISSNMGLCGSYNGNLLKFVDATVAKEDYVAPIGNKAIHRFERDPIYEGRVIDKYEYINLKTDMDLLHDMCMKLKNDFNSKKYKAIRIIYTRYINSITFLPTIFQFLPVQVPHDKWKHADYAPPLFEAKPRDLIHRLLPSYLTSILYEVLVESELSEQASRRTAMDNANDNADELLDKLTIEYNKARQNAITQQITEVAGGANASN